MHDFTCLRCSSKFYSAAADLTPLKCPYCGFVAGQKGLESRMDERRPLRGDCRLFNDGPAIPTETTDISRIGAGVVMKGTAAIKRDDTVRVEIDGLDLRSVARVVWVKRSGAEEWRAGLSFLEKR